MDFLIRTRVGLACHLLDFTGLSVKEIAAKVGYSDPYYFFAYFQESNGKRTRCLPSNFQRVSVELNVMENSASVPGAYYRTPEVHDTLFSFHFSDSLSGGRSVVVAEGRLSRCSGLYGFGAAPYRECAIAQVIELRSHPTGNLFDLLRKYWRRGWDSVKDLLVSCLIIH